MTELLSSAASASDPPLLPLSQGICDQDDQLSPSPPDLNQLQRDLKDLDPMWPTKESEVWEKRFQRSSAAPSSSSSSGSSSGSSDTANISLAGEAGIADASYLSNLVQSTNVGVGQLSGLAMQWESSHSNAVRLLREELDALASQKQEAESKRRRILDEGAFYVDSKRSVVADREIVGHLEEDDFTTGTRGFSCSSSSSSCSSSSSSGASSGPSPSCSSSKHNLVGKACELTLEERDESHGQFYHRVDYWRKKAETLNQLLTESLHREEMLLKKLQEHKDTECNKVPVSELQNQLRRVDNFLHFVLRNSPVVICHQDKELRYRFVYNQYPEWQAEIIGKTDLDLISGPNATETFNFKKEVLSRGCPAKREFTYETKEFGFKAFLVCAEPVFNKEGDTIGVNVLSMDVSEEVANREKLIRLREEAAVQRAMETQLHKTMRITEETMKAKQLLATMSHEIRSPLSGVVSMAEILAATSLDPEQKHLVDIMMSSGDLVMQLINDILDLSKVESGAMKLEATKFRPREVVMNVLQMAAASLQKRNLNLEGSVSAEVPFEVIGDVLRVRQILTNLVSNAIKFTRDGSVQIILEVIPHNKKITSQQNGTEVQHQLPSLNMPQWVNNDTVWLQVQVKDTGIGIPDSALPFLFTKYMQVSETHARKYGGTGLGLAICKQLVELMGGKLIVTSQENVGSTFLFTLPCKLPAPASNGSCEAAGGNTDFKFTPSPRLIRHVSSSRMRHGGEVVVPSESCGSTLTGSREETREQSSEASANSSVQKAEKLKVLLAEDSKVNVMVAQSMLRRLGLEATVVNNGAEAVEAVKREFYDLILMDVCMPVMDGLEATRLIREHQEKRSVIVALTANALPEHVAECYTHGMESFIAKPVTFNKLQQVIQQFYPKVSTSATSPPPLPPPPPSPSSNTKEK